MLPAQLLSRSAATLTPFSLAQSTTARLVRAIQPASHVRFSATSPIPGREGDGGVAASSEVEGLADQEKHVAHIAGVNALAVERFEGRFLVSGGADAEISMWDLEVADESEARQTNAQPLTHKPLGTAVKSKNTHKYGITAVTFYPFDSLAFLSSSYDHSLKLWDSTTLIPSATFDLSSVVYSHSISPISTQLLVACATQHPLIRLIDLRSGAATHTLAGHSGGAVLSVAWSPKDEHILASGATDGTVRFWDVRRSAGNLGSLDMEDSVGFVGYDQLGQGARRRDRGMAHAGPVNGVVWTEDARHVVTTSHDEKIRVWDNHTGANTLANFGPVVRNRHLSTLLPLISPRGLMPAGEDVLFFPNEKEILVYEMFEGRLVKRLKVPGTAAVPNRASSGARNVKDRVTALAWRAYNLEMLSAHSDGTIRSWRPRTREDAFVDDEELKEDFGNDVEAESRKRKRQVLEDIERDLTQPKITFT